MSEKNYFASPADYNADYFDNVLSAAAAASMPFLTEQGYIQVPGASVSGSQVNYNNQVFNITDKYVNPNPQYYTTTPAAFQEVWPRPDRFPNAAYYSSNNTFNSTIDCVGFACRVLAATGGNTTETNAYCQLHQAFRSIPGTSFPPVLGVVPEAYQFAVSLAALEGNTGPWSYVAGFVNPAKINILGYTGQSKPGFSATQAGDILCLGFVGPGSNGHFMVLTQAPQQLDLQSLQQQGVQLPAIVKAGYNVGVYDSTNSGSSLHIVDSRRSDNISGIGYGEIYVFTNEAGEPVGYIFGLKDDGSLQPAYFVSGAYGTYESEVVAITVGRYGG